MIQVYKFEQKNQLRLYLFRTQAFRGLCKYDLLSNIFWRNYDIISIFSPFFRYLIPSEWQFWLQWNDYRINGQLCYWLAFMWLTIACIIDYHMWVAMLFSKHAQSGCIMKSSQLTRVEIGILKVMLKFWSFVLTRNFLSIASNLPTMTAHHKYLIFSSKVNYL